MNITKPNSYHESFLKQQYKNQCFVNMHSAQMLSWRNEKCHKVIKKGGTSLIFDPSDAAN